MAVISRAEARVVAAIAEVFGVFGAEIFLCVFAFVLTQTVLGSWPAARLRVSKGDERYKLKARRRPGDRASTVRPVPISGALDILVFKAAIHNKDLDKAVDIFNAAQGAWPQPLLLGGRALLVRLVRLAAERPGALPRLLDDCHAAGLAAADVEAMVIAAARSGSAGACSVCSHAEELARTDGAQLSSAAFAALIAGYGDSENAARLFAEAARKGRASLEVLASTLKAASGAGQSFVDAVISRCQGPMPATVAATLVLHQLGQPLRSGQGQPAQAAVYVAGTEEEELALLSAYECHLLGVPLSSIDRAVGWFVADSALRHGRFDLLPGIAAAMGEEVNQQAAIRVLGRASRAEDAARLFQACPQKSPCLYNALLDACAEAGATELAEKVMAEAISAGKANIVTFNTMLKVHVCPCSASGHAVQRHAKFGPLIDKMKECGLQPNQVSCAILLKSVQRNTPATDVEQTLAVVDGIGEMDDVLLTSLIEACHRVGRTDLLHSRLRRLQSAPSARTWHAFASIIRAYGCLGDLAGAWEAWRDLRSSGLTPSKIAIGCMVEALASNSETEAGYELICQLRMETDGLLNSVIYGTVLKGFAHQKNFERVWKVYSEMLAEGVDFTVITFNTLVDACARCNQMARLPEILSEMSRQGIKLDKITYSAIVKGYCQEGKVNQASEVIERMHRESEHKMDEFFYNALLGGCAKARLWSRGLQIFEDMQGKGFKTSNITLSVLVNLAVRASSLDDAFSLCERAAVAHELRLNGHVFNNLIQGCVFHRDLPRALKVLKWMLSERVQPDARTYTLMLRAMLSAGRQPDAAALLRAACGASGCELPAELSGVGPAALRFNGQLPKDLVREVLENIVRHSGDCREATQQLCRDLIHAGVAMNSKAMLRLASGN